MAVDERFALSAGDVTDQHGSLVARATMGSVLFARPPSKLMAFSRSGRFMVRSATPGRGSVRITVSAMRTP